MTGGTEQLLDCLDEEQRLVATSVDGPVCVLAGAGTGKTRAITHRIAYAVAQGAYEPQHVLALTFTTRAAAHMRSRLRDLGVAAVQARTFHSAALRQLQYFWPHSVGGAMPALLKHKGAMIAEVLRRAHLNSDTATVRDVATEIEWAKASMLTPEEYLKRATTRGRAGGFEWEVIARILRGYEELKTERGLIDFDDVLLLTAAILREDAKIAAQVRSQYRHFVVDEYQDVSGVQHALLDLWLGQRQTVCVVGDPHQTIYSFTGATSDYLLNFSERYPDARLVRLVRDYRSTPQVVDLANRLIATATSTQAGPSSSRGSLRLIAQKPPGPAPVFATCPDDEAEARTVVKVIEGLIANGVPVGEIAVLFRTNAQSALYENALAEAGLAYQVRGGERFFGRREVREALMALSAALRSTSSTSAPGQPGELPPVVQQVKDILSSIGYSEVAPTGRVARERWESLSALVALAQEMTASRGPQFDLAAFVAEIKERDSAQYAPTVAGMTLASFHSTKGLEWDAVFLVGLSEGLMPISLAETQAAIEEERRLLYVAITRARTHIHLSWSMARTSGNRPHRRQSRFLASLAPGQSRPGATKPRAAGRKPQPAQCRYCARGLATALERKTGRCSQCPAQYSEQTLEALRAWRTGQALQQQVPAYVVFTDATLVAFAEVKPRSLTQLQAMPGVGPAKLEKYGEAVLSVIAEQEPRR